MKPLLIFSFVFSVLLLQVSGKAVFAHFMVGNTYSYTPTLFQNDIKAATAAGLDAFALNVGADSWTWDRVSMLYDTAQTWGNFKLFLSFDMDFYSEVAPIVTAIQAYANHSNQYLHNGQVFVSTFAGEFVTLGADTANDGWQNIKNTLQQANINIYFIPEWSGEDAYTVYSNNPVVDGIFTWIAWPGGNDNSSVLVTTDQIYQSGAQQANKTYMAPISPWFYTHISSSSNYLYKCELLWQQRWEQLLALNPDFIEIATWNDWGESSYVGGFDPNPGDFPAGSNAYTQGLTHQAWQAILPYYVSAYKNGIRPAVITDTLIYWYRPFFKNANATNDSLGPPVVENQDITASPYGPSILSDSVFIVAILKATAQVTLTSGISSQSATLSAGVNAISLPFSEGKQTVTLTRGASTICSSTGTIPIGSQPSIFNYNAYVGQCRVPPQCGTS